MNLIIIYVLITVVVSAMCSILESALLSTPLSYVTTLESKNHPKAKRLRLYKEDIDRPISAILTLNTIANTAGAALVGAQATQVFGNAFVGVTSAVFTLLILVFSEIIPKTIGADYWRKIILPASSIIRVLIIITYPIVLLLQWITGLVTSDNRPAAVSREEVSAMVTVGAEEGVLEKKENKMIQNLLKLDEITAHEIMTPSVVVSMADSSMTLKEFYEDEELSTYSRIPIYDDDNSDYITGYVLRQTILERLAEDKFNVHLKELARPILSFSEEEPVANIWEKLLEKKEHISIIIDEYGSLRGIVTLEDVIETMLGFEIVDEKDEVVDMQEYAKAQWKQMQKKQLKKHPNK